MGDVLDRGHAAASDPAHNWHTFQRNSEVTREGVPRMLLTPALAISLFVRIRDNARRGKLDHF